MGRTVPWLGCSRKKGKCAIILVIKQQKRKEHQGVRHIASLNCISYSGRIIAFAGHGDCRGGFSGTDSYEGIVPFHIDRHEPSD